MRTWLLFFGSSPSPLTSHFIFSFFFCVFYLVLSLLICLTLSRLYSRSSLLCQILSEVDFVHSHALSRKASISLRAQGNMSDASSSFTLYQCTVCVSLRMHGFLRAPDPVGEAEEACQCFTLGWYSIDNVFTNNI